MSGNMTRVEMIRFLNGKKIFVSKKDSTERLCRKMARLEREQEFRRLDRLVRKMTKRVQRAVAKGRTLSSWMVDALNSGDFNEAVLIRAKKVAYER